MLFKCFFFRFGQTLFNLAHMSAVHFWRSLLIAYLITLRPEKLLVWKKVWKKSWSLDPKICANPVLYSGRDMQRDLECIPFRTKFWKLCSEIKWNGPFRFGPTGIVFWLTFIHLSLLFPFFSQYGCFVYCLQVQYGRHQGISVRIQGTPHPQFLYHLRPEGPKRFFLDRLEELNEME